MKKRKTHAAEFEAYFFDAIRKELKLAELAKT
jgi:hypothetical protein